MDFYEFMMAETQLISASVIALEYSWWIKYSTSSVEKDTYVY